MSITRSSFFLKEMMDLETGLPIGWKVTADVPMGSWETSSLQSYIRTHVNGLGLLEVYFFPVSVYYKHPSLRMNPVHLADVLTQLMDWEDLVY